MTDPKPKRSIRISGVVLAEVLILLFSYKAYLPTRHQRNAGRAGNTIARLVLDDPGLVESMAFYVVAFHVVVAVLLGVARWSLVRRRRRGDM